MMIFFFLWLTHFAKAEDLSNTQVAFRDGCSGEKVALTGPSKPYLSIRLVGLDPDEWLTVKVTWRPVGLTEDLSHEQTREDTYTRVPRWAFGRAVGEDGRVSMKLSLPPAKWLDEMEQKHQTARIWQADVRWWQGGIEPRSGTAITAIARTLPDAKEFFQVRGPRECIWESKATVSSKPYENRVNDFMNVTREITSINQASWLNGIAVGPNNMNGQPLPMFNNAITGSNYGWFYADWQRQLTREQYVQFERKWVLRREDFGVFAKRFSYSRVPVRRWEWVKAPRSCGKWVPQEYGNLDIGIETEDFYVIPRSAYGDSQSTSNNIDLIHPPLDTCEEHVGRGPEHATLIKPNGLTGLLYYYPLRNSL